MTLESVEHFEILFYSDTASRYLLRHLSVEPCNDCRTEVDLKDRILAEIPELEGAEPLKSAELLLGWAARTADWALDRGTVVPGFESMTVSEMVFDVFDRDRGGVYCGGQSSFYMKLLHLFGVDAFTVDFGIRGSSLTHVSVIVPWQGRNYLFDPTFRITFVGDKDYKALEDVLESQRSGRAEAIRLMELSVAGRSLMGKWDPSKWDPRGYCRDLEFLGSDDIRCIWGDASFFDFYLASWSKEIRSAGLPADASLLPELMGRGVLSIGPGIHSDSNQSFRNALIGLGIPSPRENAGARR